MARFRFARLLSARLDGRGNDQENSRRQPGKAVRVLNAGEQSGSAFKAMDKKIAVLTTGANGSCIAADLIRAELDVSMIDQ